MRILFCRIAWMKEYKGASEDDMPRHGGNYIVENGEGIEQSNFLPEKVYSGWEDVSGMVLRGIYNFGVVNTYFWNKKREQYVEKELHLENIKGYTALKNEKFVPDVLVIWFAKYATHDFRVVGWYRNATVYRCYQNFNGASYNVLAKTGDCTLLPVDKRDTELWNIPNSKYNPLDFGFGHFMVWYAREENEEKEQFVKRLVHNINNYDKNRR